jgi:hypothetical protein
MFRQLASSCNAAHLDKGVIVCAERGLGQVCWGRLRGPHPRNGTRQRRQLLRLCLQWGRGWSRQLLRWCLQWGRGWPRQHLALLHGPPPSCWRVLSTMAPTLLLLLLRMSTPLPPLGAAASCLSLSCCLCCNPSLCMRGSFLLLLLLLLGPGLSRGIRTTVSPSAPVAAPSCVMLRW